MSSINIVKHKKFQNNFPNLDIIEYLIENYEIKNEKNERIIKEDLLNNNEILNYFIYQKRNQKNKNKDNLIHLLSNELNK